MLSLLIEQSTPFIQLQDLGRFGYRHLGVTQGGSLDWVSMGWANWLLGNSLDAAVVEINLGGFSLISQGNATLAIAGADLNATLDGVPLPASGTLKMRDGQRLRFDQPRNGARAYLAAPGGFQCQRQLGSVSTVAREQLGGLHANGKALASGDYLHGGADSTKTRELPRAAITDFSGESRLELIIGAQIGKFSGLSLFEAFNCQWTVDYRADRMGVRLRGPLLECNHNSMVSEGIALGAVQVPPDGQPIALLNDRQTIGGYPRLGALTPLAVARLAQCLPGDRLRLIPTVQETAHVDHLKILAQWV